MSSLSNLKHVSEKDRKMIQDAEVMMGPDPDEIGFIKNMFYGNFRNDLMFPYPKSTPTEEAKCEALMSKLENYLENEHPSILIDQEEEIPQWVLDKLFDMGVMGMTIPEEFGGLGLGITSYNRVLEAIGGRCAATSVVVSAHQSIGCKALMLFGTEAQKKEFLPIVARQHLSAFCLSEPNVGCDAGGQETKVELTEDGKYYILNGEKKWSTSGAYAGLYTVMAEQQVVDAKTGKTKRGITAVIVTPDMNGIDIFENNRSKCGIRGSWQARIRFNNVKVPRERLLHIEGKGLQVALTCLNYGRCTLSAGTYGAAKKAMDQAIKWSQTRYQFQRPLSDFQLVKERIAHMSALNYAMDAMLYMMTGMLDRHDQDIMVETAATKVFCSEMAWQVINDAMQIMGGDGYMTENELERAFRDSRIYTIVEGANEVMFSFIFAYGGKPLAEQMIGIKDRLLWDEHEGFGANLGRIFPNLFNPSLVVKAIPIGVEAILGKRKSAPTLTGVHSSLQSLAARLAKQIAEHTYQFKKMSLVHKEEIVTRQVVQKRLADNTIHMFAMACSLSKLNSQIEAGESGTQFEADKAAVRHFFDIGELKIKENIRALYDNADESMMKASEAAITHNDTLVNSQFAIPESSPVAKGTGKNTKNEHIPEFKGRHMWYQELEDAVTTA
jgi:alkylation response protein AidB-like acyl-CoA dehydrogenase